VDNQVSGLIEHDAGYISPDEPRNQFINENKKN
jgi:hypothetical protein